MKVGDLVKVVQELGCHIPAKLTRDRGLGVITEIEERESLLHPVVGEINLGSSVIVALSYGPVERFHEKDIVRIYDHEDR